MRKGYFEQHFDAAGWQQATHNALNPAQHPMQLVRTADGEPLTVQVKIGMQPLHLKAWRLDVGRVPLYLLDADLEINPEPLRNVTHALYQGGNEQRLQQEIILGIGGVRLLRALGVETVTAFLELCSGRGSGGQPVLTMTVLNDHHRMHE